MGSSPLKIKICATEAEAMRVATLPWDSQNGIPSPILKARCLLAAGTFDVEG